MKTGSKHTKETQEKMRISAQKRIMPPMTEEHKKKLRESNKKTWSNLELLNKHSKETLKRLSLLSSEEKERRLEKLRKMSQTFEARERARKTMIRLRQDPEFIKKAKEKQKKIIKTGDKNPFYGRKHKIETRLKISKNKKESEKTPRGPKNPAWIDGRGEERKDKRVTFSHTIEYRLFREAVLKRDNYTCKKCGERGRRLHVDHIKSFRKFPELRLQISNGRVLCLDCHKKTPNYGRKEDYAKTLSTSK